MKNQAKKSTEKKVTKINLSNIQQKFEKIKENVFEKQSFVRQGLYKYSEDEIKQISISDKNGKSIRNKIRRKFDTLVNNVSVSIKKGEGVETSLKEFKTYYFERCVINDYSVTSVSNKKDSAKNSLFLTQLGIALQLLKENPNL